MSEQRNLIVAIVLSVLVLAIYQVFVVGPQVEEERARQQALEAASQADSGTPSAATAPNATASGIPGVPGSAAQVKGADRQAVLNASGRVRILTPRLKGSIALAGARIDDLTLRDYRVSVDEGADNVILLSPPGGPNPYFVQYGWVTDGAQTLDVPAPDSVWQADKESIGPGESVRLSWSNGTGQTFIQDISVDENYLFSVRQRVENAGSDAITVYPYGRIRRVGEPDTLGFYILHEGPLGVFDDILNEVDYDDVADAPGGRIPATSKAGGWIGITDKYWLTALIPDQKQAFSGEFNHAKSGQDPAYQSSFLLSAATAPAGGATEVMSNAFLGAKLVELLDSYGETLSIPRFDLAVDFGWFYWLTKPLFKALHWLYLQVGNFGVAILILTVGIKLVFFPLANKSYKSMSKMKQLQPEMMKLRERYSDDRQKMNQAMMELYKKEKVNPASGCLPILIQIPVFFALYKVLFVTIEMRHEPFFGWIHDLSAPDPTTFMNLFGLFDWTPPAAFAIVSIGVWPILMGISMFCQQKLNPQPADPVQAKIFLFMPIMFTFLLGQFPAGLVIYWTWNNLLSMAQQYVIMKRMGVPIGGGQQPSTT